MSSWLIVRYSREKRQKMPQRVAIIGAGTWGTTLAVVLARKGIRVELHSFFNDHNLSMQKERENKLFLKGTKFPPSLQINLSLKNLLSNNEIIIIAVPVQFVGNILKKIKKENVYFKNKVFVSVSKGVEEKSLKRVSELITEELGDITVAVLSGPNIAREVLQGIPTATVVACRNRIVARRLQVLFTNPAFRVYMHQDVAGVEFGGALKNIIAIACGIADGLGFGTNTKAALVTRGLIEIIRLGHTLGAKQDTFWGISGMGDVVTTCFSPYSRNRHVGEQIGKGKTLKEVVSKMKMIAEGVETVKSAFKLGKKLNIDLPITNEVYAVLYNKKSPQKAVADLMKRPLKAEA